MDTIASSRDMQSMTTAPCQLISEPQNPSCYTQMTIARVTLLILCPHLGSVAEVSWLSLGRPYTTSGRPPAPSALSRPSVAFRPLGRLLVILGRPLAGEKALTNDCV